MIFAFFWCFETWLPLLLSELVSGPGSSVRQVLIFQSSDSVAQRKHLPLFCEMAGR